MLSRPCDGKKCIICKKLILVSEMGGQIAVPAKKLSKLTAKASAALKMHWNIALKSNFVHDLCYSTLTESDTLSNKELTILEQVEETLERFSTLEEVKRQADDVAKMIKDAERTICFTGAGISASAGIATYRGAEGIDTLAEVSASSATAVPSDDVDDVDTDYTLLQPTFAHRALVDLHRRGMMRYIITQNCDGLHGKAGFPRDSMSDLHGNVFVEYCEKCKVEYERDYCVDLYSTECHEEAWYETCPDCDWNHYTGRKCNAKRCRGKLRDTIVNFGDDLHGTVLGGLRRAEHESMEADVCLAVGSSLTVRPACTLPAQATKLVIVNLQASYLDKRATVRVWAAADVFFAYLMQSLGNSDPAMV